jgi:hypothetical protein
LSTEFPTAAVTTVTSEKQKVASPKKYKTVPESWKALPEATFRQVISDLESVLFEISVDGVGVNTPDGRISAQTLNRWAEHLRKALAALSKGQ